jgi:hypothetical protein
MQSDVNVMISMHCTVQYSTYSDYAVAHSFLTVLTPSGQQLHEVVPKRATPRISELDEAGRS